MGRRRTPGIAGLTHSAIARAFTALTAVLLLATLAGVALLWPSGPVVVEGAERPAEGLIVQAEVVSVRAVPCPPPGGSGCRVAGVRLLSGPDRGQTFDLPLTEGAPTLELEAGDRVRLVRTSSEGTPEASGARAAAYTLVDFERRAPLLWLTLLFAAAVVALGRWRGALSLAGLAISLVVVVGFLAPALLGGEAPLAVALVSALAVMFATMALSHGVNPKSVAAALGTTATLALTIGLAVAFTDLAHITGLSSEESTLLTGGQQRLSLEGLVLAGIVIGALGVLDDVTVSQAATVMALRRANPALSVRQLYRAALDVGRDHVSAMVNTLVLAYVGASLPLVLVFSVGGRSFSDTVNIEVVAEKVVATLVGSIGLVAAVPLTTLLAALLAHGSAPETLEP